jgi:hypothetical protein
MPRTKTSASGRQKNPVTLLDYLSFGIGASAGYLASHYTGHADSGYSTTAGGFAGMGIQRAVVAALSSRVQRRRLSRRAAALAETLNSSNHLPVDDLSARLHLRADGRTTKSCSSRMSHSKKSSRAYSKLFLTAAIRNCRGPIGIAHKGATPSRMGLGRSTPAS